MRLEILCQDRPGMAKDILIILNSYEIEPLAIDASHAGYFYFQMVKVEFELLRELLSEIRKLDGVFDVKTVKAMPSEKDFNALKTLLKTLPEAVFSIDTKTKINTVNKSALLILEAEESDVINNPLTQWVSGFNFNRWFNDNPESSHVTPIVVNNKECLAEILPIYLPEEDEKEVLVGAVVSLRSIARIGKQYHALQDKGYRFDSILAVSESMKIALEQAKKAATTDTPLLLSGEAGTGKSIVARACHESSLRKGNPFIVVHCASLDKDAFMAFLGTAESKNQTEKCTFKQASGGTIFFDEISAMPKNVQVSLALYLQEKKWSASDDDIRIMCGTHHDLEDLCKLGKFSKELYHQLAGLNIHIQALRERPTDIIPLTEFFLAHYSQQFGNSLGCISKACREHLLNYSWPGNVRQLKNVIFRSVSLWEHSTELTINQLQLSYSESAGYYDFEGTLEQSMKDFEEGLLRQLYPSYPSTRQLAKKLGLSHTAIANKLREYNIPK